jgi:hypothetical protein
LAIESDYNLRLVFVEYEQKNLQLLLHHQSIVEIVQNHHLIYIYINMITKILLLDIQSPINILSEIPNAEYNQ